MPTINEVVTSSNHLLHECAEHGTVSCIDKITEFIKYLEKVQDPRFPLFYHMPGIYCNQ